MKFSICIPTNSLDQRIWNTLDGLNDVEGDFEICLSLEGNHYPWLIEELGKRVDVLKIYPDSLGVATAKNRAMELAAEDWTVLLDGDDFLVPSALRQYEAFINENPDLKMGSELSLINMIEHDGRVQAFHPPTPFDALWFYNKVMVENKVEKVPGWGRPLLFKTFECFQFDEAKDNLLEDRDMIYGLWAQGFTVHMLPTLTYVYNINPSGITEGKNISDVPKYQECLKDIWYRHGHSIQEPIIKTYVQMNSLSAKDLEAIRKIEAIEQVRRMK